MNRIQLTRGDITWLEVETTAAKESLLGGGGVDGSVHRAAGPQLLAECIAAGLCPEGEARLTKGYRLSAKWIIHAVGPVYEDGSWDESEILASAYRSTLELARENNINSLAFPCLATGHYDYPNDETCAIAVATVTAWLHENA